MARFFFAKKLTGASNVRLRRCHGEDLRQPVHGGSRWLDFCHHVQRTSDLYHEWRADCTTEFSAARFVSDSMIVDVRVSDLPNPSPGNLIVIGMNAPVSIDAHDTRPLMRSNDDLWLAIPTPPLEKAQPAVNLPLRIATSHGSAPVVHLPPSQANPAVAKGRLNLKGAAVASQSKTGRGLAIASILLLLPQVKLRKRLNLARDAKVLRNVRLKKQWHRSPQSKTFGLWHWHPGPRGLHI